MRPPRTSGSGPASDAGIPQKCTLLRWQVLCNARRFSPEPPQQQPDERDPDPGQRTGDAFFVILAQPPVASQPAKRPLHDPAPLQHLEPFGNRRLLTLGQPDFARHDVRLAHDLQVDASLLAHAHDAGARVAAIGPDLLERLVLGVRQFDDIDAAVAILDISAIDQDGARQSEDVDDDVALAPLDLLTRVVAATRGIFFSVLFTV